MTEQFESFIKNYWNYYRELEDEFLETKRYVEIDENNFKTFSLEYLKLFQAVCSEVDIVGKVLAAEQNVAFSPDDKQNNILKWWYEIQDLTVTIGESVCNLSDCVISYLEVSIPTSPWKDFRVEKYRDKRGRIRYKRNYIPSWWNSHNKVKHSRTMTITGTNSVTNYSLANLENLLSAFAGLYILELLLMEKSATRYDLQAFADHSKLFAVNEYLTEEDIKAIIDQAFDSDT